MTPPARPRSELLLPPGARLLHIGPHKTGTTSLQHAAARARTTLLSHGVRYPGHAVDHARPAISAMGRSTGWTKVSGEKPDPAQWLDLLDEVSAATSERVLISSELFCDATPEEIDRIVDALGENVHVVLTLRPLGQILPSSWQQSLKSGRATTLDDWLQQLLETAPPDGPDRELGELATSGWRHDHAALAARWARVVGTEQVTVVVLDPDDRAMLGDTFESLLGLPAGVLASTGADPRNRGMTAGEAELVRLTNASLSAAKLPKTVYGQIVRHGAVAEMIESRSVGKDEPRLVLPSWAAEPIGHLASRAARELAGLGVRVVGDLDGYAAWRPAETHPEEPTWVPAEAAAAALRGAVAGANGGRRLLTSGFVASKHSDPRPVGSLTSRELARELVRRVKRRVTRFGFR